MTDLTDLTEFDGGPARKLTKFDGGPKRQASEEFIDYYRSATVGARRVPSSARARKPTTTRSERVDGRCRCRWLFW